MTYPLGGRFTACGLAHLLAILTLATGCSQTQPPDRVELTLVDRAGFDAVLVRAKGRVILVDCWATWCLPCVAQLPHSIDLAREHGDAGLEVVTLNFDDVDMEDGDSTATATAILKKSGAPAAHVTNLQTRLGGSTESMDAFEITSGALPHYKLYDRQGQLRKVFELDPAANKQFTPAEIDATVADLLAEH